MRQNDWRKAMAEFLTLKTRDDFQRLIDEGLEESLTLDYKASPSLGRDSSQVNELCKDVSAFANSAGGQIIYGIEEDKQTHRPVRVDDGVADPKVTREWIEQILNSKVHPRMHGINIGRVELSVGKYGFIISVPPTTSGPHQAPDKKYYRRFELQSVAMEDYEIRDVMQRRLRPEPFVVVRLPNDPFTLSWGSNTTHSQLVRLHMEISNRSSEPADCVLVTLFLDGDFVINNYGTPERRTVHIGDERMHALSFHFISPNHFPIFKEAVFPVGDGTLISIPPQLQDEDVRFRIGYSVQTPGYSTETWGAVIKRRQSLVLRWNVPAQD